MFSYEPDDTVVHALDPRSKLLVQVGFAITAVTQTSPAVIAGCTVFAGAVLAATRLSPLRVLRTFWFVLVILALAPLFAMLTFGPPWIVPDRAIPSVLAGYQVLLVIFVSAAYVRSTPVRETRAAIQRHVPGKAGRLLGVGVGLLLRLFPLLLQDIDRVRLAIRARSGTGVARDTWIRLVTVGGLRRALHRAETLSLALRARCFAWNPTLPALELSPRDYPVLALGAVLVLLPVALAAT